jgi:hypothetical protein
MGVSISSPRWSPPPEGTMLVNVDVALFSCLSQMRVGVLIRSHIGICFIACSQVFDKITAQELEEAPSIRRAMALVHEEGFRQNRLGFRLLMINYPAYQSSFDGSNRHWRGGSRRQCNGDRFFVCDVPSYSLRSLLIDSDLVHLCAKFESIKKDRREYMLVDCLMRQHTF